MIKDLFSKQKEALDYFFSHLDKERCELFFNELKKVKGTFFLTGVGKSGLIAQKIAATMMSTGSKALFLPPIDALHGDLAMVTNQDSVICLSKSGETEEILHLLPFLRNRGVKLLALTSNSQSHLAKSVDFHLELPCERELCPFDLAPTISTSIQLLFGDVMAIALMREKSFSIDDFAQNHPAGRIGKRATVRVQDLMLDQNKIALCLPSATVEEVLIDFTEKRCGCLVVIDEKRELKGIFTDGDLRRALQSKGESLLKQKIEKIMTKQPKAISEKARAFEALQMMENDQNHPVMVLPVLTEEGKVAGLIKMHDIIQAGVN